MDLPNRCFPSVSTFISVFALERCCVVCEWDTIWLSGHNANGSARKSTGGGRREKS